MENELLIQASTGNEKAFRLLYDMFRNKIFSIASKLTGLESAAEDVVQEVFIKLWLHKEKLSEINHFNSYLNTLIRNHIFNALRKIAHEDAFLRRLIYKSEKVSKDSFDQVVYNQLQKLVSKAVDLLPPQQKKVYLLSRTEGLAHNEIASRLHISRSTVKGHMVEALKSIKTYLLSHTDQALIIALASVSVTPL